MRTHRLIQLFVQAQHAPAMAMAQNSVEKGASSLAYRQLMAGYPATVRAWREQLSYLTQQALHREDEQAATLANNLAHHFKQDGNFTQALPLFERALAIAMQKLGKAHPNTVVFASNLAWLREKMPSP